MPTINVGNLLGRSFITDPDEEGEQLRARIESIEDTEDSTADGKQRLWKFKCRVGNDKFQEVLTYNQMLDWCEREQTSDDMYKFDAILDHRWDSSKRRWEVLVLWATSERTWVNLSTIWEDDPPTVAMYAKRNNLLNTPGWKRCRRLFRTEKNIRQDGQPSKAQELQKQACLQVWSPSSPQP